MWRYCDDLSFWNILAHKETLTDKLVSVVMKK